jgi:predicted hydrocarbon binding protein
MDDLVKSVYILHTDGIALLSVDLGKVTDESIGAFMDLFGGFSSAINTLLLELGHRELKSITVSDGVLVYSSHDPVLVVIHTLNPKHEQFAKLMVKQVEHEFTKAYASSLDDPDSFVRSDNFTAFEGKIREIYANLKKLYTDYPEILEFLPSFIPLNRLYQVLNLGLDIIEGFPEDTIRLIRELDKYFTEDEGMVEVVAQTLGRYAGHRIARDRFKNEFVIDPHKVLTLLNEISVTKYDAKQESYDVVLCPICRGKKADKPVCEFFSGFIEGAFDNPSISVQETSCRAMGEKSCRFKLNRT